MHRLSLLATILFTLILLSSCTKSKVQGEPGYVVLSPEMAEILCTLGVEDRIIGITAECDYPPELLNKPTVGNFGALKKEAIVELNPSIIFTSGLEQEAIAADLNKLGFHVESFYPQSIAELIDGIIDIGSLVDRQPQAQTLADSMRSFVTSQKAQNQHKLRPKVYLEIYRDPLMSVSDASFVGQLIELAGGNNVFDSLERDYARIDPERLIRANPDIMICYSQDSMESILQRKGWGEIAALKTGRVYFETDIDPSLIQRAGPRFIQGVQKLSEIIQDWEPTE